MDKIIQFSSEDSLGNAFAEAIDVTPRSGGGLTKIAGKLHPQVQLFMRGLRPDPAFQYVLMTPMGAFEFWGVNANGDIFPEMALKYDREKEDHTPYVKALAEKWLAPFGKSLPPGDYTTFGHKSFLDAKRYLHHANKNPDIAYGDIVCAVWNPDMHRVEVISRHFREKARQVGAGEVIDDLDAGKPRQISMGCRVSFDVCTICGHLSKTQADYCSHLQTSMGRIMPDGRIVGAVNLFPKFFDLSDVFVPAAKESGVLMKVASDRRVFDMKVAQDKRAAQNKKAMDKEVLPNASHRAIQDTVSAESDIPQGILRSGDFGSLLSTLAAMGIVLKPREFQDGMLSRMGHGDLADDLWKSNRSFSPCSCGVGPMEMGSPDFSLAEKLSPLLGARSGFYPHLPQRILRVVVLRTAPSAEPEKIASDGVLQKVAVAYDAYRKALNSLPRHVEVAFTANPGYYTRHFMDDLLSDTLTKSASYHGMALSSPMVPMYVYSASRGEVLEPPRDFLSVSSSSPVRALFHPAF